MPNLPEFDPAKWAKALVVAVEQLPQWVQIVLAVVFILALGVAPVIRAFRGRG